MIPTIIMWLYHKHGDPFNIASGFPLLSRGNWVQELEEEEKENKYSLASCFSYLAQHSAKASARLNAPSTTEGIWQGKSFLQVNRTNTPASANTTGFLIDICMNLPHLFCIQPLIMVLSTSQSQIMVVGMQRTRDSAVLFWESGRKEQWNRYPPAVYHWASHSGCC